MLKQTGTHAPDPCHASSLETAMQSPPVHSICSVESQRRGTAACQMNLQASDTIEVTMDTIHSGCSKAGPELLRTSTESLIFYLSDYNPTLQRSPKKGKIKNKINSTNVLQEAEGRRMCSAQLPCFSQFESEPLTFILSIEIGL